MKLVIEMLDQKALEDFSVMYPKPKKPGLGCSKLWLNLTTGLANQWLHFCWNNFVIYRYL